MITKWEGKDKKNRDRSLRAPEAQSPGASENSRRTAGMMEEWKDQRSEVRDQRPQDQRTGKTAGFAQSFAVPRKTPVE
jgi:hypothetical protein